MTAGDLITADVQAEIAGLLLGADTAYVIEAFNPWAGVDWRTDDRPRAQAHGVWPATDLWGTRRVGLAVTVNSTAGKQAALAAWYALAAAFAPGSGPVELVWQEAGVKYRLVGRARLAEPDVSDLAQGVIRADCRFEATSPFIETLAEQTGSTGLGTPAGGRSYPRSHPWGYGAPSTPGLIYATNEGTAPASWAATVVGPVTAPRLENETTGEVLDLSGTVSAGETLEINSATRTLLLDGTSSRASWLRPGSAWWAFPPGAATTVRFEASGGSGSLTLRWRDTWY